MKRPEDFMWLAPTNEDLRNQLCAWANQRIMNPILRKMRNDAEILAAARCQLGTGYDWNGLPMLEFMVRTYAAYTEFSKNKVTV